jgi:hypothetical protein
VATSVFACPDARGAQWQLGALPPPIGRLLLVGWRPDPQSPEGSIAADAAVVLAGAICTAGRVTFLSSAVSGAATSEWSSRGDAWMVTLPAGLGARVGAALKGTPADVGLISTRDPATAVQMFDDGGFPWWMQAQVALVSNADAAPPSLDRERVLNLLAADWTSHVGALGESGIRVVMRPGVDGDVAGLLSLLPDAESELIGALEAHCRNAGIAWSIVPEDEFARQYTA